ncbi:unnamed protein product [Penicillium salamii]|uniref:Uncharacterized protein n=1 Tax=Penicillium salamii TaxID=1612424 RepID=A0A9W4K0R9_9EURO|nr:unnamed protein product [Penicillium salamii]CAG7957735.1 unnamed protein product [Penicillium salamii]CAG8223565.1 unnamed protein product [Penicillium salamii]CAG8310267.1 unnamed protein product [Penicillium salamii]CAG8320063.1 unnamed protein product [Penicillium salamii]
MTTAPPVHAVPDSGMPGHLVNLPRYHPIAMNPNPPPHMPPPEMMQNHHYRHYAPMHEHHPAVPPVHSPATLEHIEARLRHLEHEEMARNATRSRILAMRKHEDEEFRAMTERAEAEEEDLRRQRKKLKRESMGLGLNAVADSPPLRPTPPRRLSETSAATTLAFFKQQSPPEPRQAPLPPSSQAPPMPPPHMHAQPHHQAPPPPPPSHPIVSHDSLHNGSIRRKQKYTIKNVEAWGERHGRPAAHDPSGRALWKRPSDGSLVYLTCPIQGCGKSDFVTLHGFMCHLTKKHKDRTLGSQSRALEVCGVVFDPNAPLPPVMNHRGSTEGSPPGSNPLDQDGDQHDDEMDSDSEMEPEYGVKTELLDRFMPDAEGTPTESTPPKPMNGSTKQSIMSIIDRTPETEREALAALPSADPQGPPPESSVPSKRKYEYSPPTAEKENAEPNERAE